MDCAESQIRQSLPSPGNVSALLKCNYIEPLQPIIYAVRNKNDYR